VHYSFCSAFCASSLSFAAPLVSLQLLNLGFPFFSILHASAYGAVVAICETSDFCKYCKSGRSLRDYHK
jgi:hypothetical protein